MPLHWTEQSAAQIRTLEFIVTYLAAMALREGPKPKHPADVVSRAVKALRVAYPDDRSPALKDETVSIMRMAVKLAWPRQPRKKRPLPHRKKRPHQAQ